ncbi:MAG TPA: hypothetical protein VF202_12260 [Trueperaceae bacterium]
MSMEAITAARKLTLPPRDKNEVLASLEGIPGTHAVSAVLAAALPGDTP